MQADEVQAVDWRDASEVLRVAVRVEGVGKDSVQGDVRFADMLGQMGARIEYGANYIQAGAFRSFAIRDGNLVTGQENFSGAETARLILEAVGR